MTLIDDWKEVLTKAWSLKFGAAGFVFGALNALTELGVTLPYLERWLPPKTFLLLSAACAVAALIARLLKQANLQPEATDADQQA